MNITISIAIQHTHKSRVYSNIVLLFMIIIGIYIY